MLSIIHQLSLRIKLIVFTLPLKKEKSNYIANILQLVNNYISFNK